MRVEYNGADYYVDPRYDHRDLLIPHRNRNLRYVTIGQIISRLSPGGLRELYFVPEQEVPIAAVKPYIPVPV